MTKVFLQALIYIFITLTYCNCQVNKIHYNSKATQFNNEAVEFMKVQNLESALVYLNKATEMDSTYYAAYGNKSSVYCSLKDFKNALLAIQKEINIKPDLAEAWVFGGMLYDRLGDTLNAKMYYKKKH